MSGEARRGLGRIVEQCMVPGEYDRLNDAVYLHESAREHIVCENMTEEVRLRKVFIRSDRMVC